MKAHDEIAKIFKFLLATDDAQRATFYRDPKFTIKATRTAKPRANCRYESFIVTVGQPNYAERKFIKDCQKAGEPFPVRDVQLKAFPKKRTIPLTRLKRLARKAKAGKRLARAEVRSLAAAALAAA